MSRLRYASLETKGYRFPASHPLERPIVYSPEASDSLLEQHRRIAQKFKIANPYFLYSQKGDSLIINENIGQGVALKVGPVGAFSHQQLATTIQEQACIYVARGTMGKNFPKDDPKKVDELLAVMMSGFSELRTVVLFEKATKDGIKPIVGVQANPGNQNTQLLQTMLNNFIEGNREFIESSLSTLNALRFSQISLELVKFLAKYGELSETETVSMSRLYAVTQEECAYLDIDIRGFPWIAMAALAIGIQANGIHFSDSQTPPQICLYDTHEPNIQGKLESLFGMKLIEKDAIEPTSRIENSILRHHYLSKAHGGFQEDICIGYVPIEEYVQHALKLLVAKKIPINTDLLS